MMRLLCALLLAVVSGAGGAFESAQSAHAEGLSNLYQVSPTLYRSAMPEEPGFESLHRLGIASVLSLRWHPDPEPTATGAGPRRLHIPIRTWDLEEEQVVQFLRLANDPANQPMLVHCKHGAYRTGTMVAAYRIVVQGWSKEDALDEMKTEQYGHHWIWANLRRFIRNMDVERIRRAAGLPVAAARAQSR